MDLVEGIIQAARAVGADPLDLATAISYETGGTWNPRQPGPYTKWGRHRGLIQFGQPQADQYSVDFSSPETALATQLGPEGAIVKYLRGSGFKPGMSGMDLYSTINAGGPGRYNASDAKAGGAPGDVRDKWVNQMLAHRQKAMALMSGRPDLTGSGRPALGETPVGAQGGIVGKIAANLGAGANANVKLDLNKKKTGPKNIFSALSDIGDAFSGATGGGGGEMQPPQLTSGLSFGDDTARYAAGAQLMSQILASRRLPALSMGMM